MAIPSLCPVARASRRGGAARKVLVVLGLLVLLAIGLAVAAPSLLSAFVAGAIERAANDGMSGRVEVRRLSLSWLGPQEIGSIVVTDPSGQTVADLSARAQAGLLGLAAGSRDLGLVRLRGLLDLRHTPEGELNLASALASPSSGPIVVPPGGTPASPPRAPKQVRVPKGLAFEIDATNMEIRYLPPGPGRTGVGFKTTKGAAVFAAGKPVDFELEARTLDGRRALALDFHADRLTDDRGVLALREAQMELTIDGTVPADYVDAFAEIVARGREGGATVGRAPDGGLSLNASLVSRDGRLILADVTEPAMITGRVPAALLRMISAGDVSVHVDTPPRATIAIQQLDVPLAKSGSLIDADWRNSILFAGVATDEISGTVSLDGGEAKPFRIEPIQASLRPMDPLMNMNLTSTIIASFDDQRAGTIELDLRVAGVLNQEGRPRIGPFAPGGEGYVVVPGPEYLRGVVRVNDFPTALLQPITERAGIALERVTGPTLAIDLRSGVRQGTSELPTEVVKGDGQTAELPPIGQPYLAMTLVSSKTSAWVDLILEAGRIKTRNKGIKVQTDAAGELIRAFLPDEGVEVAGEGIGFVELVDVDVPLAGSGPDFRQASGNYRVVVGNLDVRTAPDASVLRLESLDAALGLFPSGTPTWGIDARASYEGQAFAIVGNGEVPGLITGAGRAHSQSGLSPADARPTGKLKLLDVPTRVASLISQRAGRLAEAAAGASVRGTIESSARGENGARVEVSLEGTDAVAQGGFDVDAHRAMFDEAGLTLTFFEPGRVLSALADAGQEEPPLRFEDSGRATLTISETTIPLRAGEGAGPLTGAAARASLRANDLSGIIRAEGRRARLAIESIEADAALSRSGDLTLSLASEGEVDGEPLSSSGAIAVRGMRGAGDEIDLGSARLEGSWRAENVPTSLAALVDPKQADVVRELVGDSIDVALTPDGEARSARGAWRLVATGRETELATRIGVGENALEIGPTTGRVVVTPQAVEAAMIAYQPDRTPRPRLEAPVAFALSGESARVALIDGYRPATKDAAGIGVELRATSDLVFRDLAQVGDEGVVALGMRGLRVGTGTSDVFGPIARAESTLFLPEEPGAAAGRLSATVSLIPGEFSGEFHLTDADADALDAMLAMKGLVTDAVGDRLTIDVRAAPSGEDGRRTPIVAQVRSPRLKVDAELRRGEGGIELARPASADWLMTRSMMERILFDAKEGEAPALRVEEDVRANLRVDELRLGPSSGPLRPGVFRLRSGIRLDPVLFASSESGERVSLPASSGRLGMDAKTGALTFELAAADDASTGEGSEADASAGALSIDASLADYADEAGAPTFDRARLTATITGELPSALLDALGSMDGLLSALVGPRVSADIRTERLSRAESSGTVDADVRAPYAEFSLRGGLERGPEGPVFAASEPGELRVVEITNEASERVLSVLFPLLAKFEKSPEDEPAVIKMEGLTLPLDGKTRSLNGDLRVDPGTMRFESKGFFSQILKATHTRQVGTIGRRIEPFVVNLDRGVVRFEGVIIPAGEFDFETYGKVNLNRRTMDVYAMIPLYAVQDDLASVARRVPGVGKLTRLPIRIKGDLSDPGVGLDPKELIEKLPENIGKGAEDLLKQPGKVLEDLFGGGKKKKNE